MPPAMRIAALFLGPIQTHQYDGAPVRTAGHKRPVDAARLTPLGLVGDEQADRRYHGGPDQALCVYGLAQYEHWRPILGPALGPSFGPGAFSENLTLDGFDETTACIGDTLRLGARETAPLVQISLPRQPCGRLAGKLGRPDLVKLVKDSGLSGCYLRVVDPGDGEVRAGDAVVRTARPAHGVTLTDTNRVKYRQTRDRAALLHVLSAPELAAVWRRQLEQRL